MSKFNIGFIQGRLVDQVYDRIQAFPLNSWKEEIKLALENDFNLMEWTIDYDFFYENPIFSDNDKQFFLKQNNFNINSITLDFSMHVPFWKCTGSLRKEVINRHIKLIESLSDTDINILVLPLVDNGSIENVKQEKDLIEGLIDITKYLQRYNKKIAFESDLPPNNLKKFINKFDEEFYGINYDTGNSAALGYDLEQEIDCYGDKIINIHIKDRIYKGNTVNLGFGSYDFKTFFKYFNDMSYAGNLILQTARHKNRHLQTLKKNRDFIKDYLGQKFTNE
jgi:L-ribulose-5-phosphate 3-epimerase